MLEFKIEREVTNLLEDFTKKFDKENDTLKISISFSLNDLNQIDEERIFSQTNDKNLNEKFQRALKRKITDLNIVQVKNIKPKSYTIQHQFNYRFLPNNQLSKILLDSNLTYKGGVIQEVPLFSSQQRVNNQTDRDIFNSLMKEHISKNFIYPRNALEKGIQGIIHITFIIEKNGEISNLRTKGPSPILENEAIRIISLLPKFQPGLVNVRPVRVPYSIPVTFRLQ